MFFSGGLGSACTEGDYLACSGGKSCTSQTGWQEAPCGRVHCGRRCAGNAVLEGRRLLSVGEGEAQGSRGLQCLMCETWKGGPQSRQPLAAILESLWYATTGPNQCSVLPLTTPPAAAHAHSPPAVPLPCGLSLAACSDEEEGSEEDEEGLTKLDRRRRERAAGDHPLQGAFREASAALLAKYGIQPAGA